MQIPTRKMALKKVPLKNAVLYSFPFQNDQLLYFEKSKKNLRFLAAGGQTPFPP